jgi:hypothetical protein
LLRQVAGCPAHSPWRRQRVDGRDDSDSGHRRAASCWIEARVDILAADRWIRTVGSPAEFGNFDGETPHLGASPDGLAARISRFGDADPTRFSGPMRCGNPATYPGPFLPRPLLQGFLRFGDEKRDVLAAWEARLRHIVG